MFLPSNRPGAKALLAASPSSLTAGRLSWRRSGGGGSFVAPVASKPLAANRKGVGAGAGGSVANAWSVAAAGSGRKEVGGERRGNSLRMATRLEIVNDADIPETAEFFVENFWDDAVAPSQQKRSLVRELVSDYRRRYGTLMGNRKLQSMLMVARGNRGEIIGCIAVEVSVCMGERVGVKARGISPNAEGAELRPILANLAVARSERYLLVYRYTTCCCCSFIFRCSSLLLLLLSLSSQKTVPVSARCAVKKVLNVVYVLLH
ncbi:unnamed protein product, partial [Ectocarpus sp. 12 AP-2014]